MFVLGEKLTKENSRIGERQKGARFALIVLSGINLLNYADRYVPSGVKELIKDDLNLTDAETSLPTTGMIGVYMIFAMIFGWMGDRNIIDRRYILAGGIAFWSLATALAGLAQNLEQLIILRSLVGVGEAAYATIGPPMISDFFPHRDRNVAFGIYYLAIPIGAALGFGIGAVLGAAFSWRVAFLAVGIPGVVAAITVLRCNDPVPGINDEEEEVEDSNKNKEFSVETSLLPPAANSTSDGSYSSMLYTFFDECMQVLSNKYYFYSLAGLVANNFALGGLAEWAPTFFSRYNDISIGSAGIIVGAATILGGIGGNLLGAKVTQYYDLKKVKNAYFLIPALFTIPGAIFLLLTINITGYAAIAVVCVFISEICIWTNLAPMSTLSITCIPPHLRARSCGILIFMQHVLGDMISPPIIGVISDEYDSLKKGLQITWMFVFVSGAFWYIGYLTLPHFDMKTNNADTNSNQSQTTYLELLIGPETQDNTSNNVEDNKEERHSQSSNRGSQKQKYADVDLDVAILESR
jgi:MFS family permease